MAIYTGAQRKPMGQWVVLKDGKRLSPRTSQALRNHSPDGFSWGFHGSGPAQLALALLLDVTGDPVVAEHWHQRFKADVVAEWPQDGDWMITSERIERWLRSARQRWPARAAQEVTR